VKKGFVALLIVLAIVVLISPGIVGRLAEKSMDENIDWAATESQEVVVTSQGFDRGWFSSEGQHRVEIREGELQNMLLALADSDDALDLPALVIDTRLDHGLIPLASMSRDKGTLMPGLGSAISTVSVEFMDGEIIKLPGTIYSDVGLTGELRSRLELEAGSHVFDGASTLWGDTTVEVTTDSTTGNIRFDGRVASLALTAEGDHVDISQVEFAGKQSKTPFGFSVGDVGARVHSMTVQQLGESTTFGPLSFNTTSGVDGERVSGRTTIDLENTPFGELGTAGFTADVSLVDVDGASLGYIIDALDRLQGGGSLDDFVFVVQDDLQRMLAAGFELRFDQLDISLPQGSLSSKFRFVVDASDPDTFTWTSVLLALDATAELSMPTELVEFLTTIDPQMNATIGMGFLRRNGDVYELEATFQKGLLTVNGAPMPIPIPGIQ